MTTQVLPTQAKTSDSPAAVLVWTRLLRAHAATTRALSSDLQASHGLTINDYEALLVLSHAADRRLRRVDLARRLVLTPSGVTRLLEGLEQAGLVDRTACPSDLRVVYAQLTDAGATALASASCGHIGSIRALFEEHLTSEELDQLATLLAKLPDVTGHDDSCTPA